MIKQDKRPAYTIRLCIPFPFFFLYTNNKDRKIQFRFQVDLKFQLGPPDGMREAARLIWYIEGDTRKSAAGWKQKLAFADR